MWSPIVYLTKEEFENFDAVKDRYVPEGVEYGLMKCRRIVTATIDEKQTVDASDEYVVYVGRYEPYTFGQELIDLACPESSLH